MEVVPTNDGDEDDGVIWFRCPQCQGFLPKLSGADLQENTEPESTDPAPAAAPETKKSDDSMEWDSPADMMASLEKGETEIPVDAVDLDELSELGGLVEPDDLDDLDDPDDPLLGTTNAPAGKSEKPAPEEESSPEPIMEYAALLAAKDPTDAAAYRPWGTYEVGQCIHHLAWDDCGVVVAKEILPGGRQVIKVFFEEAGVVRLIEQAPR